ncbi:hypothetical protein EON80_29655, partial [bacterium]
MTSSQTNLSTAATHLLALKSSDYETRKAAFDAIKDLPPFQLGQAWQSARALEPIHGGELDCLHRVEVVTDALEFDRAIVTVISPAYEWLLRHLLRSLKRVGNTVPVVAFCIDESYENMADWPDLVRVRCHSRERIDASVKGVIYSCARWVKAAHIISLEADMLVLESLDPLWAILEQTRSGTLAGCRPQYFPEIQSIQHVLDRERQKLTPLPWLGDEEFAFNGGLLAGDARAWEELDTRLRDMAPFSHVFTEGATRHPFADEILMNWALSSMSHLELHQGWNVQFYSKKRWEWLTTLPGPQGREYRCHSHPAKVLHFVGPSRTGEDNLLDVFLREIEENTLPASPPAS